ncbi:hypothetical protein CHS0354_017382 [Potamilus streckersoni]|uniref:Aminotransferase class I/classII large domain-containing protein n=1 Tax=Potamilus streckersoni TaxID=2493646 RepID=A0AAE0W7V5_9BIVA|nr:hypothetical protein CHS0354_017382 [Potamilus streckersoni]
MSKKRDLFEDLGFSDGVDSGAFPFAMGAPGPKSMAGCSELMITATQLCLGNKEEERYTFQYGPMKGDPGFLEELAKFLSQEYGDQVDSHNLMVTAGATQGLHLVATVMFDRTTPVFVEDPTYFIAIKILKDDFKMNVIPVPTDKEGIDVEEFEKLIQKHKPKDLDLTQYKCPFWSFVYLTPTFNNPRGCSLSNARSEKLIQVARKHDMLLFAEDVYNLLNYTDQRHPPSRLLSYDKSTDPDYGGGNVLSNGTFSKIFAPGVRLGWIEAPEKILRHLEKCSITWSGGAFNHYMSKLMATALQEGLLMKHLIHLRQEYGERMNLMDKALRENLPPGVKFENPKGGFFLWLELPEGCDSEKVLRHAVEKYKVNFIHGNSTSPTGSFRNFARLSISYCDKEDLVTGVEGFCAAVKDVLSM